jgi:hypothetical protein
MMKGREGSVFEALARLPKAGVVLIGGYAVNAYVPPRYSIDCDVVVLGSTKEVESVLQESGFREAESGDTPYGRYLRYEKSEEKVAFDLLVNSVLDRDTGVVFEAGLFEKYSAERTTTGRSVGLRATMRIADPELLFVMKFVTGRRQDVRDIFMLASIPLNWALVERLVSMKCGGGLVKERVEMIRRSISSADYRDSLQGPYGRIPDDRFEMCRRGLISFLGRLSEGG